MNACLEVLLENIGSGLTQIQASNLRGADATKGARFLAGFDVDGRHAASRPILKEMKK